MAFLVAFALAVVAVANCSAFPSPQESVGAGTSTEKCNSFEFDQWATDMSQCFGEAETELHNLFASFDFTNEELKRAICQGVAGKVTCINQRSDKCLNSDEKDNLRINTLKRDFGKAYNLTMDLGTDIITSCAVMLRHQGEVLERIGGDINKCNYIKFQTESKKWRDCVDGADEQQDYRLKLVRIAPNPKDVLVETLCRYRAEIYGTCRPILKRCESDESFARISVTLDAQFTTLETKMREVIPFFRLAGSCPIEADSADDKDADLRSTLLRILLGGGN